METTTSRGSLGTLWFGMYIQPGTSVKVIRALQWSGTATVKVIAFILAETFVMAACLEYWWLGQLYVRSTAYLWLVFSIMALVPTLGAARKDIPPALVSTALLQVIPVITSCILMVAFRLGFVDYIDRYLYRSPLLVSVVLIFMISALILKSIYRKTFLAEERHHKQVAIHFVFFMVDIILMAGFVLFLLNYEGIIIYLP